MYFGRACFAQNFDDLTRSHAAHKRIVQNLRFRIHETDEFPDRLSSI